MSGFLGDLSPEQEASLALLKERVGAWVKERVTNDGWIITEEQQ
jgi:hypothetical protein